MTPAKHEREPSAIELVQMDAELLLMHDERILSYFSRSIKLTALPVLGDRLVSVGALRAVARADGFCLVGSALVMQVPRHYLARQIVDQSIGSTKYRIRLARVLAMCTGVSIGSVVLFAPVMTVETMALISMILVGTSAASIATCQGYKPVYLTGVLPLLCAIVAIWVFGNVDESMPFFRLMVVFLTVQLGVVFYSLIGQVYGFFVQNIVTQHKLNQALNAEKIASSAKTRFLAVASHDLRQPLHAMALFSAALTIRPLDEKSKSIAVNLNEAMKALSEELDSLLDISKLDADIVPMKTATVNLSELVKRLSDSFIPGAEEKRISLNVDVEDNIFVDTDGYLLGRVIRNIMDNAVKYTNKGSIQCSLVASGDNAVVSIRDTGIGISAEEQLRVWEEFYQVSGAASTRVKGLGLGLSVVSRLASLLDIKVEIVPVEGDGSCFTVTLPTVGRLSVVSTDTTDSDVDDELSGLSGRAILVVDDVESIQRSSRVLLSELGMSVRVAGSGVQAIAHFRKHSFDCVVMDLRLGNEDDGFDVISRLRQIDASVPIIIMSGDTAPDRMRKANSMGYSWLVKPVSPEALIQVIKESLQ